MKHKLFLAVSLCVLLVVAALGAWAWCAQQTTLIIVRHADRETSADALTPAGVARALALAHTGQRIVIVGHGNTVPALIRAAGGPSLPDLEEREFDNLFIVSVCPCRPGAARLLALQYGAASP